MKTSLGLTILIILTALKVSVRIWSYSGQHFPAFRLNTERYEVSLRIQSECGKMLTRINPNMDTFNAVNAIKFNRANAMLFKVRKFVNIKTLKSTYYAIFHCHLNYANAV